MYISIAREFSIGMVLVLSCLHRIAQGMNEYQQQLTPTPAPAPEMGNEVPNAPAGAEELDSTPNIRHHATPELEILSRDQDNTRWNLRTNLSLLQSVLQAYGGHAEVAPRIFHEMPALEIPRSHHHTQHQALFPSDTTLRSAYQSMNRDIASEQAPVELRGVGGIQACGNATLLVELPSEMDSHDSELQLLAPGTIPRGTVSDMWKSKRKVWYQKVQNFVLRPAEELDAERHTPNYAPLVPERLHADDGNASRNLRVNFSAHQTITQAQSNLAELAPHVFHELPTNHHRTLGHNPSTYRPVSLSPNQSANSSTGAFLEETLQTIIGSMNEKCGIAGCAIFYTGVNSGSDMEMGTDRELDDGNLVVVDKDRY
ncbi:hypothetical protein BDZ91DRAFT_759423 [Kalaharituber pfeilii]|nr:hypothetical protein BDZ91DRAFT_759423 [Kalaharituber pfeilii]